MSARRTESKEGIDVWLWSHVAVASPDTIIIPLRDDEETKQGWREPRPISWQPKSGRENTDTSRTGLLGKKKAFHSNL